MLDFLYILFMSALLILLVPAAATLLWNVGYFLYALAHLPLYYINPRYRKER